MIIEQDSRLKNATPDERKEFLNYAKYKDFEMIEDMLDDNRTIIYSRDEKNGQTAFHILLRYADRDALNALKVIMAGEVMQELKESVQAGTKKEDEKSVLDIDFEGTNAKGQKYKINAKGMLQVMHENTKDDFALRQEFLDLIVPCISNLPMNVRTKATISPEELHKQVSQAEAQLLQTTIGREVLSKVGETKPPIKKPNATKVRNGKRGEGCSIM